MSSDPRSAAPSPGAEQGQSDLARAALVRMRGAALLDALERHAPGSRTHAEATATYAFATAVELGFTRGRAELVRETAKLHDIGKVYVPKDALSRPWDELSADELELIDSHVEPGARLARGAGIPEDPCDWISAIAARFDGQRAEALGSDEPPIEARIIRGACACDIALTTAIPRDPLAVGPDMAERRRRAVAELRDAAGRELDPDVVEGLTSVLERIGA